MQKYHRCDTIVFGEVLGHEKAFLIQNMCPITEKYMKNEYLDSVANIPVRVDDRLEKELKDKAGMIFQTRSSANTVLTWYERLWYLLEKELDASNQSNVVANLNDFKLEFFRTYSKIAFRRRILRRTNL